MELQQKMRAAIERHLPETVALRHRLHQHPELCFEEHETSKILAEEINKIPGWQLVTNIAKTGLMATFQGRNDGPCIALRADMDGLPILEQTGKSYASISAGRMHACGHDGHMASLVGAMKVIAELGTEVRGTIKALFQPAEEGGGGALLMCQEGVLEEPKVDAIFGFHGWPVTPLGTLSITPGPAWASYLHLEIEVIGRGGHAAIPHLCCDPIVVACHIVTSLQTIVSRQSDPLSAVVLSIGRISSGTTDNVIPESATLEGTIRILDGNAIPKLRSDVTALVSGIAAAFGASAKVILEPGYPVLVNDRKLTLKTTTFLDSMKSWPTVDSNYPPVMVAEDFAYYCERVPGAFFFVGLNSRVDAPMPGLHTAYFDYPDAALRFSMELLTSLGVRGSEIITAA